MLVSDDVHDCAAAILPPSQWDAWLKGTIEDAEQILESFHQPELTYLPVSEAVGSPKNDWPELVDAVDK